VTEQHFRDVDWCEVIRKLTLYAYRVFGTTLVAKGEKVLEGFGESPEDLAFSVMQKLIDPDEASICWGSSLGKPTTEKVIALLATALKHDFIDRKRSPRYKKAVELPEGSHDDATDKSAHDPKQQSEEERLALKLQREQVMQLLLRDFRTEDPLAERYLKLQFSEGEYIAYTPQQAAERLGVAVKEITNIKKRIERRIMQRLASMGDKGKAVIYDKGKATYVEEQG
jgi:DNA-directed RNA polymerase specialized sigma24 family protein